MLTPDVMNEPKKEPLELNNLLLGTGFMRMFSDTLNNRYNNLLVTVAGATVNQMGVLRGGKSLFGNLTQLLFGQLADRYGKKKLIALGQFLNTIAISALLFTETPERLILWVFISSFSVSIATPSWSSLLGDYSDDSNRGMVIGKINSITQLGSVVAMLIAFAISFGQIEATTRKSFTPVFVLSAFSSIVGGILVLFVNEKAPQGTYLQLDLRRLFLDNKLTRYLSLNFLYGIGMSTAWPLFPFIITSKLGMTVWQVASLALCGSMISTLAQRHLGRFMDRAGRKPIIVMSRVVMAIAPVAYAFSSRWYHVTVAEMILGVGMAAWMSSESTYIIDLAPEDLRATYLACSTAAFGVATFFGSYLGGYLVDKILSQSGYIGINQGLYISSILRFLVGIAYLAIAETQN